MTWKHYLFLLVLVSGTSGMVWQATSPKGYLWYPRRIEKKKENIEKIKRQNNHLQKMILAFMHDKRIIARYARDKLGWVFEGEHIFKFVGDKNAPSDVSPSKK